MLLLVINSIALGVGLAMDAFSVCIANGLKEPHMSRGRHLKMAGIYAFFQFAMPMIGWTCVHFIAEKFRAFQKFIPWIALILLLWIGGSMLIEGRKKFRGKARDKGSADKPRDEFSSKTDWAAAPDPAMPNVTKTDSSEKTMGKEAAAGREDERISTLTLLIQGVATSIDALSVGFTIAHLNVGSAFLSCLIIAIVTFFICVAGVKLGKIFGDRLDKFADILGGLILIAIGLEIFISSFF